MSISKPARDFAFDLPRSPEPYSVSWKGVNLTSEFALPVSRPAPAELIGWVHRERSERESVLAGQKGTLFTDVFAAAGMELTREFWVEQDRSAVAVRVKLQNRSAQPLRLDSLLPLRCAGAGSLLLSGKDAGEWEAVCHNRFKNGIPSSVRLGEFDEDYAHAVKGATELGDTHGAVDGNAVQIEIDCVCLVRPKDDEQSAVLLIGYLSQTDHLARFLLRTDTERRRLDVLAADCEFDGCLLPADGARASQWVLLTTGDDPNDLIEDFADRVGRYHNVQPPKEKPPSVFCTWYYYGPKYSETNLNENLATFQKQRLPFDVFLIDESWNLKWGDWQPNDRWRSGMKSAAGKIRAAGYRPGIWTCPYLVKPNTDMARNNPNWLLRRDDGSPHIFMMDGLNYVLDTTYPGVLDFIEELYRRLTNDCGFTYHKLDFMRAIFKDKGVRFHDPTVTRLQAYRMGLEAVRRGIGPDSYLSVCGGHYGGSLGLADSQRSGSDVRATWNDPPALPKFKQNILRAWMNRLWHTDADAMMVRRREKPISEESHGFLSLGKFTDAEARTIALNQYLGGGIVTFTENFSEIHADRKTLYKHVIPAGGSPCRPIDYFAPGCPSILAVPVQPACAELDPWVIAAVINWADEPATREVVLSCNVLRGLSAEQYLVCEFFEQKTLGLFNPGDAVELQGIEPHGPRLLKIIPWDGERPVLALTDLHFSAGGVEITEWDAETELVRGKVVTPWQYPVRVAAAFPSESGCELASTVVKPGEKAFALSAGGKT